MNISKKQWEIYETEWQRNIRKHNYDGERTLNLMNQSWISVTEMKVSIDDALQDAVEFTGIWHKLLAMVRNANINKNWRADDKAIH
jgi:hypothetical protein